MKKYTIFCLCMMAVAVVVFLAGISVPTPFAIGIFVAAILSDSLTTYICLRAKGVEGNPVIAFLMKKIGILGTFMIWWAIFGAIIYFRVLPATEQVQTAVGIAYWLVPLNNIWVTVRNMRRIKRQNIIRTNAS